MNFKIVQNKYGNAVLLLMLVSAIVHMAILGYLAIQSKNWYLLNYFNILDVDLLTKNTFDSAYGNMVATATMIGIYLLILKKQ